METINGFGVLITPTDGHVLFQCPVCNPEEPFDLGDVRNVLHVMDTDNDGLADIAGIGWACPNVDCSAIVNVPLEENPQFAWGKQLNQIFKSKEAMFKSISIVFTGLNVELIGSSSYLDDSFTIVADDTYDKKFKIVFAINDAEQSDLWVTTQLQDDASDWGELPVGWTALDCVMAGIVRVGASEIASEDIKAITGLNITGI